jgi:hypothetical protein
MKVEKLNPEVFLFAAAGIALLYVTYKATKAVGSGVDAVTSLPGKAIDAVGNTVTSLVNGMTDLASSAWHSATDIFDGASVKAGTTSTPRTVDPTGASFSETASNAVDLFDPRFYGAQGNTILPAQTNQSGPGGGGLAVGTSGNSSKFYSSTNPLGDFSGM